MPITGDGDDGSSSNNVDDDSLPDNLHVGGSSATTIFRVRNPAASHWFLSHLLFFVKPPLSMAPATVQPVDPNAPIQRKPVSWNNLLLGASQYNRKNMSYPIGKGQLMHIVLSSLEPI